MAKEIKQDFEKDIVYQLKHHRDQALRYLYRTYRQEFVRFAHRYHRQEEDIVDAFQEGMMAFYEYCITDKFDPDRSSPKTMLFNMSKYALFRLKKKQDLHIELNDAFLRDWEKQLNDDSGDLLGERQQLILKELEKLGIQCQEIIRLFYFFSYSMEAIAIEMGYQNGSVVRSHKSRCLKQLRNHIANLTKE